MTIYKLYFYNYDCEGRTIESTTERFFMSKAKAEQAKANHKEDAWTGRAHLTTIETED